MVKNRYSICLASDGLIINVIPKLEICMVARPGFEPRQTAPKTVVLPLYYRAIKIKKKVFLKWNANIA